MGVVPRVTELFATLDQGAALIEGVSAAVYQQTWTRPALSSLGAHYRHHLEHLSLLADALTSGVVDYDARRRDPALETDPQHALARTVQLMDAFRPLDAASLDAPLEVRMCTGSGHRRATVSTVDRELVFVISHAVHHYALMRLALEMADVQVADEVGVMFATLRHRQGLPVEDRA